MREHHVCPKCQHNRILYVEQVPDRDHSGWRPAKIATTFAGEGWLGDKTSITGALSACVCRRCGFTELYTYQPETIPIDGKYVRELIGPEPEGPYR